MAGSFLPKPKGMAGLQRPFIKMNYEPVGLCGSVWPRLGGRGPAGPLQAPPETLYLSSPPRLLPILPCTPNPCLVKKKGTTPARRSPEQEGEFNLQKFLLVSGRHLADQAWRRALCDVCRALSIFTLPRSPWPFTRPHSQEGEETMGVGGSSHRHGAGSAFVPILSHRSEVSLSAPPACLAFYVFAFFL